MSDRVCITCATAKPIDAFALRRKGGTRRRNECTPCAVEKARLRRAEVRAGKRAPRARPGPTGVLRTCTKCEHELDTSMFDRDNNRRDGLHSHCKSCRAAHNHEYLTKE